MSLQTFERGEPGWREALKLASRGARLCTLPWSWVRATMTHSDFIVVAMNKGQVSGFGLLRKGYMCDNKGCRNSSNKSWYIDAVCDQGGNGLKIMKQMSTIARKGGAKTLQLGALLEVIMYYRSKLGYKLSFTNTENPKLIQGLKKAVNAKGRINGLNTTNIKKFAALLIEQGHSIKACKYVDHTNTKELQRCGIDGYVMTLDLTKKFAAPKIPRPVAVSTRTRGRTTRRPTIGPSVLNIITPLKSKPKIHTSPNKYLNFWKDYSARHPKAKAKTAGAIWRKMSSQEKLQYAQK